MKYLLRSLEKKRILKNVGCISCICDYKYKSGQFFQRTKSVTEWVTPKSEHEEWVGIFQKAKGNKRAACAKALRCSEKDHENKDEPGYEDSCRQGREV